MFVFLSFRIFAETLNKTTPTTPLHTQQSTPPTPPSPSTNLQSSAKRPTSIRSMLPIDLSAELKSRLKKSTHASVSNLKKSASSIDAIANNNPDTVESNNQLKPMALSPDLSSSSSSDFEDGKDLGKLLRSVSKENMYSSSAGASSSSTVTSNMSKVLNNISKRLSNAATADEGKLTGTSTSDGESSGGREVKTIIKNSAVARRKKFNDG